MSPLPACTGSPADRLLIRTYNGPSSPFSFLCLASAAGGSWKAAARWPDQPARSLSAVLSSSRPARVERGGYSDGELRYGGWPLSGLNDIFQLERAAAIARHERMFA